MERLYSVVGRPRRWGMLACGRCGLGCLRANWSAPRSGAGRWSASVRWRNLFGIARRWTAGSESMQAKSLRRRAAETDEPSAETQRRSESQSRLASHRPRIGRRGERGDQQGEPSSLGGPGLRAERLARLPNLRAQHPRLLLREPGVQAYRQASANGARMARRINRPGRHRGMVEKVARSECRDRDGRPGAVGSPGRRRTCR